MNTKLGELGEGAGVIVNEKGIICGKCGEKVKFLLGIDTSQGEYGAEFYCRDCIRKAFDDAYAEWELVNAET